MTTETIMQDVSAILRRAKPPEKDLSRKEYLAFKEIRSDNTIIVVPADKRNATVILNHIDYQQKIDYYKTRLTRKIPAWTAA